MTNARQNPSGKEIRKAFKKQARSKRAVVFLSEEWIRQNTWKPSPELQALPVEQQIKDLVHMIDAEKNETFKDSMCAYRGRLIINSERS
jgi:predicted nucleic acid-binding Zn ribbon protein